MDDIPRATHYNNLAATEAGSANDSSDKARVYLECSINFVGGIGEYLDKARRIAEVVDDKALLAYIHAWGAFIYGYWKEKERSRQAFNLAKRSLPHLEQSEDLFALAESYMMLGIAETTGDLEGEQLLARAIEYAEKGGHTTNLAFSTWFLGNVYYKSGNLDRALPLYRRGWEICLENHLLRPSPIGVSTFLLGNSLIEVYLAQDDVSSIMHLFDELIDATASLLVKLRRASSQTSMIVVWERWNNAVVKRMIEKLHTTSDDFADRIQALWDNRLSNTRDLDIRFVYHLYQMRNALEKRDKDEAQVHAEWLLGQCEGEESLEKLIPLQDSLLVHLVMRHGEITREGMAKLLSSDFGLTLAVLAYRVIAEEIAQVTDWHQLGDAALTYLRGLTRLTFSWMFVDSWHPIQKFYVQCNREDALRRLADQVQQTMSDALQEEGITQLLLEPVELVEPHSLGEGAGFRVNGWEWVDPTGDCTYRLEEAGVEIHVPPNHDIHPEGNYNGPRFLQQIEGDFILETCFTDGSEGKKSGGLFVWKDECNFIRFEIPSIPWEGTVYYGANVAGKFIHPGVHAFEAEKAWLRLERQGDRFTGYVSADRESWCRVGWADISMEDPIKVGIHALCPQSPATSTRFEYFKIWKLCHK
jgi:regulation of enolase protein 1 (concanavalin A-like superfamily)/tetratricopeptide (TPR) repeat protein